MLSQRIIVWWHVGDLNICIFGNFSSLPRFAFSKWNLSSFTLLNRGFPNNTHVNSSASHNMSSRISQLSPSLANIALNFAFFCKIFDGFHFPNTFKGTAGVTPCKVMQHQNNWACHMRKLLRYFIHINESFLVSFASFI